MRIGIDARLLERRMTGIGRNLTTILAKLPEIDKVNEYYLFTYKPLPSVNSFYRNIPTRSSIIPPKLYSPIWNNFILPEYLRREKIEVFFSINNLIPLVKVPGCKYISFLHDMIHKLDADFLPKFYRWYINIYLHFSLKSSDYILTVSDFSRKAIQDFYGLPDNKIRVIHDAVDESFRPFHYTQEEKTEKLRELGLPAKVVLYVGVIENRKNIGGIIDVAAEVYKNDPQVVFVLVGRRGYGSKKHLKRASAMPNIVYMDRVDDATLKLLYNTASVFLFPTFYEGFGLPPLEAMRCGLPSVSSNNSSIPEIVGDGGLIHDVNDIHGFANDILHVINDGEFAEQLRQKGFEREKEFRLDNKVAQLVDVFNGC